MKQETRLDTGDQDDQANIEKGRKIRGVLVTFSRQDRGELFVLHEGTNVIGREPSSKICIDSDEGMSRREHAIIHCDPDGDKLVVGQGTTNPVVLDGHRIERGKEVGLVDGATFKAGSTVFQFRKIMPPNGEPSQKAKYNEEGGRQYGGGEADI